jgi:hypothetical protein
MPRISTVTSEPVLSPLTLDAIQAEATRAHLKHGENSMLSPGHGNDRRIAILAEEVGEIARELNDAAIEGRPVNRDKLIGELVQSAAMCATWIEVLRRTCETCDGEGQVSDEGYWFGYPRTVACPECSGSLRGGSGRGGVLLGLDSRQAA